MTGTLSGRGVLMWVLGFFGIIIAVNVWFVMASIRTFSGEDEQKPYLQGVEYNQTLARRAEQRALNWQASVTSTRLGGNSVRVAILLSHADGSPVSGLSLHGELRHPSDEGRDQSASLKESAPGRYEAVVNGIAPGAWDFVAVTGARQPPFETTRRLWMP
ncbi:MAG TPA: FixH family protein [Rhizomicrobium sp.]|nr:FixH family protein [Rhizomicrobium sp.]